MFFAPFFFLAQGEEKKTVFSSLLHAHREGATHHTHSTQYTHTHTQTHTNTLANNAMAATQDEGLLQAIRAVQQLRSHALVDDCPSVEAPGIGLNYTASFDTNFEDRCAFVSGVSKYVEEAQSLASLVSFK